LPNCSFPLFPHVTKIVRALSGPKYDGKYLHNIIREKLGSLRLHQTLTNVVIPTFDIKRLQPTIFSSYEVEYLIFYPTLIMKGLQMMELNCSENHSDLLNFHAPGKEKPEHKCLTLRHMHRNLSCSNLSSNLLLQNQRRRREST
jgi:hypothetical protein